MARTHFEESRPDLEPYGFTCEVWEPHPMPRADRHNELEMNFVEAGSLTYLMGGRRVTLRARHLSAFWAATPHQVLLSDDVSFYYVVTVPLAWVLGWGLPEPFVQQLLAGTVVEEPDAGVADLDMARFAQWHGDLAPGGQGGEEPVLLEVKARLLRLAASTRRAPRGSRVHRALASAGESASTNVEQMARFVARHYREPIGLDEVADAVGLHPDYAATLFRKTFGVTPTRFVLQHRIMHAQRDLVTTDAKVLQVALDAGFGSLSRFNAAFRAVCGCSPREYRALHRL
jgi:AraC family transcriptional regulator, melibiose operon regulatory protein